jgi:hypothetical protein
MGAATFDTHLVRENLPCESGANNCTPLPNLSSSKREELGNDSFPHFVHQQELVKQFLSLTLSPLWAQGMIATTTKEDFVFPLEYYLKMCLTHGRRNYTDTNPKMSSLLFFFVWGGVAFL